ncbi:MAG: PhoH family protein, partial [Burkholderia gladioli]
MKATQALEFTAPRDDNARLANLCGPLDENLRQIEQALDVTLQRRGLPQPGRRRGGAHGG